MDTPNPSPTPGNDSSSPAPSAALPASSASPVGPATVRTLLGLAWPLVVSRASQTVVGLCDALMVAGLGESALAATTAGAMNTFTVLIFPMGVAFIVSTFSSQLCGKGDLVGARRYGFYGLALAIVAQALAFVGIKAVPGVLGLLPYAADVRGLMTGYMQVRLLSVGAAITIEALGNYYGGLGKTRYPMVANVAAMGLNVLGNWFLIGGHWGAPAMGVRGAALSSVLATAVAASGLLLVFLADRPKSSAMDGAQVGTHIGTHIGTKKSALVPRLFWGEFSSMLKVGLPSGLNWFFEFAAFMFFINVVVAGLGTTSLAALMSVMQINSISFMPAFGIATAGSILVGQTIGAGNKDRVPGIVWLTFRTVAAWQGAVGLAYLVAPGTLLAAFAGQNANAFAAAGVRMLMLSTAWQIFDAGATTLAEALRATGDTAFTMWARVAIAWLLFAPGSYITARYFGGADSSAVLWVVLYLALLAAVLLLRFASGAWRRFELTSASTSASTSTPPPT